MFDLADFARNPKKYEMFRTAQISTDVLSDFEKGEYVAIEAQSQPCAPGLHSASYRKRSRN